ncbi:MAG: radical SAM protein [Syntrophales bacterium]|nr:radical SAM protein [Syntrophales bacterium]
MSIIKKTNWTASFLIFDSKFMECLAIWNKCNNKCLMCSNPPDYDKWGDYSLKSISSRIKNISLKEKEIYLTGGEPTIHPDFFSILDLIKKRCPKAKIIIDTNGRMFYYKKFLDKFLNYANIELQISLCGHNAHLHDKITEADGSFDQMVVGTKTLLDRKKKNSEVEIRVVIHKLTLPNFEKIFEFVSERFVGIKRLIFIFMEYEGMAGENIKKVGISYEEVWPYLKKAFSKIRSIPLEVRFYHFPLCVLPKKTWPYLWRTLPEKEVDFLPSCRKCLYKKYCLGVHKDYLRLVGKKEFRPINEKIKLKTINNPYHPIISLN